MEATATQIRWMIRRDLEHVLNVEKDSFEFPWKEDDFLTCLRHRNVVGMVAEDRDTIKGFMIYELLKSQIHLLSLAVHPEFRRIKIGTLMTAKLLDKLCQQRRQEIRLEVRETNLAAQMFFKKQGFKALGIVRNHYEETAEDAYVMQFTMELPPPTPIEICLQNRISQFF